MEQCTFYCVPPSQNIAQAYIRGVFYTQIEAVFEFYSNVASSA